MGKRILLIGISVILIAVILFVYTGCSKAPTTLVNPSGLNYTSAGQQIYYSGVDSAGLAVANACDNCHGPVGLQGTINVNGQNVVAPPLIWRVLTSATDSRPAYDTARFERAVTQALDSEGNPMPDMTPTTMSKTDLSDLKNTSNLFNSFIGFAF